MKTGFHAAVRRGVPLASVLLLSAGLGIVYTPAMAAAADPEPAVVTAEAGPSAEALDEAAVVASDGEIDAAAVPEEPADAPADEATSDDAAPEAEAPAEPVAPAEPADEPAAESADEPAAEVVAEPAEEPAAAEPDAAEVVADEAAEAPSADVASEPVAEAPADVTDAAVAPVQAEAGFVPITAMAEITSGGIIGVTKPNSSPVGNGWQTDFACTWSVPPGANPGDWFEMTLPPELSWATTGSFPLYAAGSTTVVIANGVMSAGPPASVRFELTDYFLTHRDGASGTCQFKTIFQTTSTEDTIDANFDIGTTVVPVEIDVRNCPEECEEITAPTKGGWWTNSADHTRITFHIRTSRTPIAGNVVIEDTPVSSDVDGNGPDYIGPGYLLECDITADFSPEANDDTEPVVPSAVGRSGHLAADGTYTEYLDGDPVAPLYTPTVVCDNADEDNQYLSVTWPNLPAGMVANAHYHATVTDPGREAYVNGATVTMGDHTVHTVHTEVVDNSPSGSGSGPGIHIEKWNDEGEDPGLVPAEDCDPADGRICFAGDYDVAPGAELTFGLPTEIFFTITNTGDQPLYNIAVSDQLTGGSGVISDLTCDFSPLGGPNSGTTWLETKPADVADGFQPGDAFTCTGILPPLAPGQTHSDRAAVTAVNMPGDDVNGDPIPETPVSDDDPWNAHVPPPQDELIPDIHLEKWNDEGDEPTTDETPFAGDYDTAPGLEMVDGVPTQIHFTITNTGMTELYNILVSDSTDAGTDGDIQNLSCDFTPIGGPATGVEFEGPFEVQESFECTGTLVLDAGDVHADTATVTAEGPPFYDEEGNPIPGSGTPLDDDDPWNAHVPGVPDIHLEKWNDEGEAPTTDETPFAGDYDAAPGLEVEEDAATAINFTITNTGTTELFNIEVSDETNAGTVGTVQGLTCDFTGIGGPASGTTFAGPFAIGESFTCTGTLEGLPAGSVHSDTATVTAEGPPTTDEEGNETPGEPLEDTDDWNAIVSSVGAVVEEPPAPPVVNPPAAPRPPAAPVVPVVPTLPSTGSDGLGLVGLAAASLAFGVALMAARRRWSASTAR